MLFRWQLICGSRKTLQVGFLSVAQCPSLVELELYVALASCEFDLLAVLLLRYPPPLPPLPIHL